MGELRDIEGRIAKGEGTSLMPRLEALRLQAKQGVIFNAVSQYLANFKAQEHCYKEVYELLFPIKAYLSPESQLQLHTAAYELCDYSLVTELAAVCFRNYPDPLIALHSAEAFAATSQVKPAIGWLKAAHGSGIHRLRDVLLRPTFDPIREEPSFQAFLRSL